MKIAISILLIFLFNAGHTQPRHFLFIGMDRDLLKDTATWTLPVFDGVQIAYSWRQLEPQKDHYDFSMVDEDLALLNKYGKKLFIQFQDVSFSMKYNHAPKYLLTDSIYHGGTNKQYKFFNQSETDYNEAGWVTRRWDPAVQDRLHKFYKMLGDHLDGKVEGVNTEETSVDFGNGPLHPRGFSYERYKQATIENLRALKNAFPKSLVLVYANFMPGGYLPTGDSSYLKDVYDFAVEQHIGVGGPDLLPFKPGQMANSYGFIKKNSGKVATGVAVQDGTMNFINPKTRQKVTAAEIYSFGREWLGLSYFFWGSEEPFLHSEVTPFLQNLRK